MKDKIDLLLKIIITIYRDLKLQRTCFKHNDTEDAQKISEEIIQLIEELGLHK